MADAYKTVARVAEGAVYRDRGSRFLSFAFPVRDSSEAASAVEGLRKDHRGARHVCWAYVLGDGMPVSSDDGEPSGTAGRPIAGQLRSASLSYVLIAVVRYFGGTLLGTGGLTTAYKTAARLAVEAAEIVEMRHNASLTLTFPYPAANDVMRVVKASGARVVGQSWDNLCTLQVEVPLDDAGQMKQKLKNICEIKA